MHYIYNTTLITATCFSPQRGHPQGVLVYCVSRVTQQCVHGAVHDREHTQTSRLLKLLCAYPSLQSYTDEIVTALHIENDRKFRRLF
jgi:choline dehydrogenase-like flavoprotein